MSMMGFGGLSTFSARGVVGGAAIHEYWRVYITNNHAGGATYITLDELEFRATVGGADQATGGTVIKSGEFSTYTAVKVFDNTLDTGWAVSAIANQWIGYQFASPVSVAEIMMRASSEAVIGTPMGRSPKDCKLEYSDDGIVWAEEFSFRFLPVQRAERVFPTLPASGYHIGWRIFCSTNNGDANIGFSDIEMRATASGSDQTISPLDDEGQFGGRSDTDSHFSSLDDFKAFDGSGATRWTAAGSTNHWVAFYFDVAVKVEEVALMATTVPNAAGKDMLLQYTDDGITWTTQKTFAQQTGWTSNEVRVLAAI